MARTAITVQTLSVAGITPTYQAGDSANGMYFDHPGGDEVFIHAKNTNAAQRTLTVETPGTVQGLAIADNAVVLPLTTGDKMIKCPMSLFRQADGQVYINLDASTGVTIAVFKF